MLDLTPFQRILPCLRCSYEEYFRWFAKEMAKNVMLGFVRQNKEKQLTPFPPKQ